MAGPWKNITLDEVWGLLDVCNPRAKVEGERGYDNPKWEPVHVSAAVLLWDTGPPVGTKHNRRFRVYVPDERPEHERLLDGVELSATASGKCELCAVREDLDGALRYWIGYRWVYLLATRRYAWAHRDPADLTHVEWAPDHDYLWPCTETTRPCAVALWLPKEERT